MSRTSYFHTKLITNSLEALVGVPPRSLKIGDQIGPLRGITAVGEISPNRLSQASSISQLANLRVTLFDSQRPAEREREREQFEQIFVSDEVIEDGPVASSSVEIGCGPATRSGEQVSLGGTNSSTN